MKAPSTWRKAKRREPSGQAESELAEGSSPDQVVGSADLNTLDGSPADGTSAPNTPTVAPAVAAHVAPAVAAHDGGRIGANRAEQRLSAQYDIARILADSDSLEGAVKDVLRSVCESLDWDLGALWQVDPTGQVLRCVDVWSRAALDAPRFEEATRTRTFERGVGLPGRTWEIGKPMWIPDVVRDDNFPRGSVAEEEGLHGAFASPILLGSDVLGVVEFFSRDIRSIDEDLLTMMAATGSQIGQFIQRRQAEAELTSLFQLERAARQEADSVNARLRRLQVVTDVLMAHLSLEDLLRELLDAVREVLGTNTATMLLVTEDRRNLVVRAVSGDEAGTLGEIRVPMGKGIEGKVASRRQPKIVDDVPLAAPYSQYMKTKVKSLVAVPLEAGGEVIGVMHAATFRHRKFTYEELNLLRLVAERAGVAIENARLYEAEQQARQEAEAAQLRLGFLAEAGTLLAGSLQLDEALERLASLAVDFLTDICLIDLLEEDGAIRRVVALHADPKKQALTDQLKERFAPDPYGPHPAVAVMRGTGPMFSEEMTDEFLRETCRNEEHFRLTKELGFESYVSVPLAAAGRVFGTLTLVSTRGDRRYDMTDVALAEDLARRAGLAVANARLYGSEQDARLIAQKAATRTMVLQSLTAALSEAVSTNDVAKVVIERGLPVLGANAGSVVVLREDGQTLEVVGALGYPGPVLEKWENLSVDAHLPIAEAVRSGEPVLVRDASDWDRFDPEAVRAAAENGGRTWAAVPMVVEGSVVGALGMNFPDLIELDQDEMGFMLSLARQCGQALERTRLFESEQQARREAEAARARLLFLAEASDVFSATLDSEIVLESIAKMSVPRLADWCVVDLLEPNGTIRQTAVSHVIPSMEKVARELRDRYPPDPEPPHAVWKVLMTGEPDLAPDITEEDLRARAKDELHLKMLTDLGISSHIVVPLKARGRILGAVSFISMSRTYGQDDLALAEDLVTRAALAVDNARLYQQQLHAARALQRSLLPPIPPEVPGIEIASRYRAAGEGTDVGGDFYDVFETRDGTWVMVIGDVCGKGPEAAAVTGLARHTIRATAMHEDRPSAVLGLLNQAMLDQVADGRFCTVCFARVHPTESGARVTVCSAGHPLPLVLRAGGKVEMVGEPGRLLGVFSETVLSDQMVELHPGDALVLYTDGVTEEARQGVHFGLARLRAAVRGCAGSDADGLAEGIERAVFGSGHGEVARDDVAILVVRVPPGGATD